MKKTLCIILSVLILLSCCVFAFASDTDLTVGEFAECICSAIGDDKFAEVMSAYDVDVTSIPTNMSLSTEQIYQFLSWFLDDGCMDIYTAEYCIDSFFSLYCKLTEEQYEELIELFNYYGVPSYNDVYYRIKNNAVEIIGIKKNKTEVVLPSEIEGYPVLSIANNAFEDCKNIISVEISDSVTNIGSNAFHNCTSLSSITIPDSVTSIGNYAFMGCSSLENITVGNGVKTIGSSVFSNCTSLKYVEIGRNIKSINYDAFEGCSSLESINVDEENTYYSSINGVLFNKDKTVLILHPLKNNYISIPDSVYCIKRGAFEGTDYYNNNNNWEDGVLYIDNCLVRAKNVSGVYTIKNGTRVIADGAFANNVWTYDEESGTDVQVDANEITSVIIPESLISIGSDAFYSCLSLENLSIPENVTYIGAYILDDTPIYANDNNWESYVNNNDTIGRVLCIDDCLISAKNIRGIYSIKNGTRLIASNAFYGCKDIAVVIPNSVNSIGENAFYDAYSGLDHIPDDYGVSQPYIWLDFTNGESEYLLNWAWNTNYSVYIQTQNYNFYFNRDIDNYPNIKTNAYCEYTGDEKSITVPTKIFDYRITEFSGLYSGNKNIESATIPSGFSEVSNSMFKDCTSLKNVILPNTITSIGNYAFYNCTSLKSITIPKSVKSIGFRAFVAYNRELANYYFYPESIKGYSGSYAETYAKENGIKFIALDLSGWVTKDGKKYYYKNGEPITGLRSVNGKKYYFGKDGAMYVSRLISVSGKKYYMGKDGAAYTSKLISVSGKKYYMGKDGVAYTKKLISVDGKKYYMGSDGVAYTSKLISVDGKKYYMGKDGVAYKSKLISVDGKKYYIGSDCVAYKSKFASLSGKKYYFGSDCVMYKSKTFSVSGVKWKADSNGVCKKV